MARGALGLPSTSKRSLRSLRGSNFRVRLSFMRAWTVPLLVGAPPSVCSMPEARYVPPSMPGWLMGLMKFSVWAKRL